MIRQCVICSLGLVLLGCTDLGGAPETAPTEPIIERHDELFPGVVGVFFTEGTTVEQAEQLVSSLALSFKFAPTGTPLNRVISVPVGTEDEWVVKFTAYPIVKSAERIGFIWIQ
jgi:hypothetical protein